MDETYIKVKGKWRYLYRAVNKEGKTLIVLELKGSDLKKERELAGIAKAKKEGKVERYHMESLQEKYTTNH